MLELCAPGYLAHHIFAPMCSGKDEPANPQCLTVEQHKQRTRADVTACSAKPESWSSDEQRGGGLSACGCHVSHRTGEFHCLQVSGCGCACQSAACPANSR